jgi:hypothetical protein
LLHENNQQDQLQNQPNNISTGTTFIVVCYISDCT